MSEYNSSTKRAVLSSILVTSLLSIGGGLVSVFFNNIWTFEQEEVAIRGAIRVEQFSIGLLRSCLGTTNHIAHDSIINQSQQAKWECHDYQQADYAPQNNNIDIMRFCMIGSAAACMFCVLTASVGVCIRNRSFLKPLVKLMALVACGGGAAGVVAVGYMFEDLSIESKCPPWLLNRATEAYGETLALGWTFHVACATTAMTLLSAILSVILLFVIVDEADAKENTRKREQEFELESKRVRELKRNTALNVSAESPVKTTLDDRRELEIGPLPFPSSDESRVFMEIGYRHDNGVANSAFEIMKNDEESAAPQLRTRIPMANMGVVAPRFAEPHARFDEPRTRFDEEVSVSSIDVCFETAQDYDAYYDQPY